MDKTTWSISLSGPEAVLEKSEKDPSISWRMFSF